jgi:hypothetical protein
MSDMQKLLSAMGLNLTIQPPTVLYHYTSMEALLAIVASGRIRASHIRYLNDYSEVEWMWQAVVQQLERRKMSADTPEQAKVSAQLLDKIENRRHRGEFVASFSENGDDLSQWRAYCSTGPGFSIGFNAAALQTQWVSNPDGGNPFFVGGSLKKVQYLEIEDPAKFEDDLDAILDLSPSMTLGFHGSVSREDSVVAWLSVIAPNFKHPAFRAENEWRLVLTKPHKPMPGQRFRPGKSSVIPYVEAILNRDHRSCAPANYIINRVIIGPTPNPELAKEALEALCLSLGHPEVEIVVSSIPYRQW